MPLKEAKFATFEVVMLPSFVWETPLACASSRTPANMQRLTDVVTVFADSPEVHRVQVEGYLNCKWPLPLPSGSETLRKVARRPKNYVILLGKNLTNIHRYWGPDAFCIHVPKCLHVEEIFRPVDITLDQWKNIWKETRDGYNPDDLPRSFHDATIEEYVKMKGIMGMFCLKLYLLEMFGKEKPWKNLQDLKEAAIKTYKSPELRAHRNNSKDQSIVRRVPDCHRRMFRC